MTTTTTNHDTPALEPVRDVSGFRIFSAGDLGAAHSMAHQMLDSGRLALGHQRLGEWLVGRVGHGSQWVHLQWHMLVFELAVGDREGALARFSEHILPATGDALTDAPAALWRIALAFPEPIDLPWAAVRAAAIDRVWDGDDRYITLHNLLALAGAGDTVTIDRWLSANARSDCRQDATLYQMAVALRCVASGEHALAVAAFEAALPDLPVLGGSRAQNQLFVELYRAVTLRGAADTTGFELDRLATH